MLIVSFAEFDFAYIYARIFRKFVEKDKYPAKMNLHENFHSNNINGELAWDEVSR